MTSIDPIAGDAAICARFAYASTLIREAGAIASEAFARLDSLTVRQKGAHDLVSEADVNTERLIRDGIARHFPADGFIGEETGDSRTGTGPGQVLPQGTWVVDPIDGTQPFLSGIPNWCVSIAFLWEGKPEFGLVFDPSHDELFCGGRIVAPTVNGRPIAASSATQLSAGLVSIGFSGRTSPGFLHEAMTRLLDGQGMFFRNGSGALSLTYVAAGRLLGHCEPFMNSWDCLAAMAIIQAAGGRVNDFLVGDALLRGNRVVGAAAGVYDVLLAMLDATPQR